REIGLVRRARMDPGVVVVAVGGREPAVAVGVALLAVLPGLLRAAAVVGLVLFVDQVGPVRAGDQEVGAGPRARRQRQIRLVRLVLAGAERTDLLAADPDVVLAEALV